jgi:hypothetical protein
MPSPRQRARHCGCATLALLAIASASAAAQPCMDRREAVELYTAAGFPIVNDQPVNRCGRPARPHVTFMDLNNDRHAEALFIDADAACYPPSGRYFALLAKDGGHWRALLSGTGSIQAQRSGNAGWPDMRVSDAGCTRDHRYGANGYAAASGCAGEAAAAAPAAAAAATPSAENTVPAAAAGAAATLSASDEAAVFKAAGFKRRGKQWRSDCGEAPPGASYTPGSIEQVADLNGDGHADVVLSEGGTFCYGHTGTGFWLLAGQAGGGWKLMTQSTGIPQFLATRGAQGWPDISIGGPGFCFPVERWNGSEYKLQRWEYEGKACKPQR